MTLANFPGWVLLGQYPIGDSDGVGSWILHHGSEAALLELPPDQRVLEDAVSAIKRLNVVVKYILVSHDHWDHFELALLHRLRKHPLFKDATWIEPRRNHCGAMRLHLGGEPLWLVHAPKHSRTDMVTIFRGLAMTGDIELGMVKSVNREVTETTKRSSLAFLASFETKYDYHIGALVSAHLNDFREGIDWPGVVSPPG